MSPLWTAAAAATAMAGRATRDFDITGISIDTRTIAPGDLFVALTAARDAHEFVAQALDKGAAGALVSRIPEGLTDAAPLILVDDVLPGLEQLGAAARARVKGKVIGVTGSVGKTSTKEMLRAILEQQGACHAAEASYNNHWGVPLTLARMPADTDFAVIEIGMNHPGEIAPLSKLTQPDVAMITTVAPAHLAAFDNIEGIAHEKASIFEGLRAGGTAVIHGDLAVTPILDVAWSGDTRAFGESDACDARLIDVALAEGETRATAQMSGQEIHFTLSTAGRHFATNALGCLVVAQALGADVAQAAKDLHRWAPPAGRGALERIALPGGAFTLIDDAFNANPSSMGVALEVLAKSNPSGQGRRVAILGDMLELGPEEIARHRDIADLPWIDSVCAVHTVGPLCAALHAALPTAKRGKHFEDAAAATAALADLAGPGDVVLVKGSKGSKVSLLVDAWRKLRQAQAS